MPHCLDRGLHRPLRVTWRPLAVLLSSLFSFLALALPVFAYSRTPGAAKLAPNTPTTFTHTFSTSRQWFKILWKKNGGNDSTMTVDQGAPTFTPSITKSTWAVGSWFNSTFRNCDDASCSGGTESYDASADVWTVANQFTLSYSTDGNGTISGSSTQLVFSGDAGSNVTAVPNAHYVFVNWSDGGTNATRHESNVTTGHSFTANFTLAKYIVTYAASTNGTLTGSSTQQVVYGGTTSLVTAVPDSGYLFAGWSDGSTSPLRFDSVSGNVAYTATFRKPTILEDVTTSLTASGGVIIGGFFSSIGSIVVIFAGLMIVLYAVRRITRLF